MKYAIVILDGASGYPLDIFDGRTSLEQANTPFLDLLAREGMTGLSKNVPEGVEPSSNVACMSIMGYDPVRYAIGRGAIEGASLGVDLQPGDVAMRMNLCCVQDGIMKSYSTGNISSVDSYAMADEIAAVLDDETFSITKGVSFRHILKVKGHPEIMDLTYTAPHNITDTSIAGCEPQGEGADLLRDYMARANEVLAASPVNARRVTEGLLPATNAWVFWPGMKPEGMESFMEKYGKEAGMLSPVDLLNGLAELTSMKRYAFPGVTDGPDNDYEAQGEGALMMLAENDLVIIHVESPDTAGHDGEAEQKVAAIEAIDREIV
ncbi:MAG: cofactor-independent phosphoglycerate mutase, partial [Actinobacteria bacterium]|nr:cofactor-independent phosphoglycerate mutase [Actinomycetota bacterium]